MFVNRCGNRQSDEELPKVVTIQKTSTHYNEDLKYSYDYVKNKPGLRSKPSCISNAKMLK